MAWLKTTYHTAPVWSPLYRGMWFAVAVVLAGYRLGAGDEGARCLGRYWLLSHSTHTTGLGEPEAFDTHSAIPSSLKHRGDVCPLAKSRLATL